MQMVYERGGIARIAEDLPEITGLSAYQVRESRKLLEANDVFKTYPLYADMTTRIGTKVELNGFYN